MCRLGELVIDMNEVDRELVGSFLWPYLRIDRTSCSILPQPGWCEVPNEARVLLYLVARKAMVALGLGIALEAAAPDEVSRLTGIPGGSVRPALKRLLKGRLVERQVGMGYRVPSWALWRARAYVRQWAPDVALGEG